MCIAGRKYVSLEIERYNSLIYTSFFSRISVVAHCDMDLHMYPMDTQTCELRIESCEYKKDVT